MEVASKSTRRRDKSIKRALYGRVGVTEYWVVDPDIEVVRLYHQSGDGFERPIELRRDTGDTLTTALLPGLEITLDGIFLASGG